MKKKGNHKTPNTLCWYCKRTTCPNGSCPWIDRGEPVEGWDAIKMAKCNVPEDANIRIPMSCYFVKKCPLFERARSVLDYQDVAAIVIKELGICKATYYRAPQLQLKKYETKTGKKIPLWVWEELAYKLDMGKHVKQKTPKSKSKDVRVEKAKKSTNDQLSTADDEK